MQPVIETEPIVETRGDDWIWPFTFSDVNDVPVDLSGCVFDGAAIRWSGGEMALTLANGRLSVNAPAGGVTIRIARADTAPVPDGQRAQAVLPITDMLDRKSTLLIVPIRVIVP